MIFQNFHYIIFNRLQVLTVVTYRWSSHQCFFKKLNLKTGRLNMEPFVPRIKEILLDIRAAVQRTKYEAQKFRAKLIYVAPGAVFCYELA